MRTGIRVVLQGLRGLAAHHELLGYMVYREIHARYRQSLLGIGWAIIKPVVTLTIFTVIFSYITRLSSDGLPYPLFAFAALLPWTLFSTCVSAGIPSLTDQANLVSKIYFPREILPIAAIIVSALDSLISFFFLGCLMLFYQVQLSWKVLYVVPILFIEALLILGITLGLAMANVWYRDVTVGSALMLQLWMYLAPIIYPFSLVPEEFRGIYSLNPLVGIVEGFRSAVIKAETPDMQLLAISAIAGIFSFLIGYRVFKACEGDFADVI